MNIKMDITLENKTILITGAAGFIGANLVEYLLSKNQGISVIGIDNMNDYYDVSLKEYRLSRIERILSKSSSAQWHFEKGNIADKAFLSNVFKKYRPQIVVNLAAQAGVRYSIDNPDVYMESNVMGFYQVLEACRHSYDNGHKGVQHLVFASSSSVYGNDQNVPYSTDNPVEHPVSLYAATKKSNELMAYSYAKLYNIPITGLRFFTVYGPAGRPDMAYYSFANKMRNGEKIRIFNYGNCKRDFTYIDDAVEGVYRVIQCPPERQTGEDGLPEAPYNLYNIGNSHPENLLDFIDMLYKELVSTGVLSKDYDLEAHKELVAMQPGDVAVTCADTKPLERDFGYKPRTPLEEGLHKFVKWYTKWNR